MNTQGTDSHPTRPPATDHTMLALLLALFAPAVLASPSATALFAPTAGGGSWLDDTGNGLGEPLNVSGMRPGATTRPSVLNRRFHRWSSRASAPPPS